MQLYVSAITLQSAENSENKNWKRKRFRIKHPLKTFPWLTTQQGIDNHKQKPRVMKNGIGVGCCMVNKEKKVNCPIKCVLGKSWPPVQRWPSRMFASKLWSKSVSMIASNVWAELGWHGGVLLPALLVVSSRELRVGELCSLQSSHLTQNRPHSLHDLCRHKREGKPTPTPQILHEIFWNDARSCWRSFKLKKDSTLELSSQ